MRSEKITSHPHLAAIEAAFPGAPDDVIASWLLDLANDLGPPGASWLNDIGGSLERWRYVRWTKQAIPFASLGEASRSTIVTLLQEYRAGPASKLTTRDGRPRAAAIATHLVKHRALPYPPTAATFVFPGYTLMDGYHRWTVWADRHGGDPLECWVASTP